MLLLPKVMLIMSSKGKPNESPKGMPIDGPGRAIIEVPTGNPVRAQREAH